MKYASTLFLRIVICLIAIGVLAGLIWEPQTEGRNVGVDFLHIYFHDPFLAYLYIAFIPFFVALYQIFKVLGYFDNNEIFSQAAVRTVKNFKYCAAAFAALLVAAEVYLFIAIR